MYVANVPSAIQVSLLILLQKYVWGCTLRIDIDLSETSSLVMFLDASIKGSVLNKLQSLFFIKDDA